MQRRHPTDRAGKLTPNRRADPRQLMPSSQTAETTRLRKSPDKGPIPRRLQFGAPRVRIFSALGTPTNATRPETALALPSRGRKQPQVTFIPVRVTSKRHRRRRRPTHPPRHSRPRAKREISQRPPCPRRTDPAGGDLLGQGIALVAATLFMLEANAPGAIADTTMCCGASSSARRLVRWIDPALEAEYE